MAACEGILENTLLLSEENRLEAAKTALEHGVPLEAEDSGGYRAMHVAARAGYHNLITFLVSKGADLNPVSKAKKGFGLSRYLLEGQSPLGLVEGTLSGIFYERPDTADFLRKLGAKSVLYLKNLLGGVQITDEGTEDEPGGYCITQCNGRCANGVECPRHFLE